MAELETICDPKLGAVRSFDQNRVGALAYAASALVDRGRLFFSNVSTDHLGIQKESHSGFQGYRPAILDEVLRAFYVARHLSVAGKSDGDQLRDQVWAARGRFVKLLQGEMGPALKKTARKKAGDELDSDPTSWLLQPRPRKW